MSPLKIYKASAGSGKTYKLTYEYLSIVVKNPYLYRSILAVTFTNKATDEMKERILTELFLLSSNKESVHLKSLMSELKISEDVVRNNAQKTFNLILHNYSNFSVSTIDSFFQKMFRAFLFELDIKFNFDLLIDNKEVLSESVRQFIDSLELEQPTTNWLIKLITNKIENEKSYNTEEDLIKLSEEIFKEKFIVEQDELFKKTNDKEFLNSFTGKLLKIRNSFIYFIKEKANKTLSKINNSGFSIDDFVGGSKGLVPFLNKLSDIKNDVKFVDTIYTTSFFKYKNIANSEGKWFSSSTKRKSEVETFCETNIKQLLIDLFAHIEKNKFDFITSKLILQNLYNLGLLSEIARETKEYTNKNGYFLLSEIPKFLSQIIGNDGASFVYEKTGTHFKHFMLDEFQDTSQLQYNNFLPLIVNSLAQGFDNLVVGDVKQSIYRWRNSSWKLLSNNIHNDTKMFNPLEITLDENYRSKPNIIDFNNALYSLLPKISSNLIEDENGKIRICELYKGHHQNIPKKKFVHNGYVKISFIDKIEFNETVLSEWLTNTVFEMWNKGIKDIAILIRNNKDIPKVFSTLFNFKNAEGEHPCIDFRIISGESLLLTASGVINFLISLIKYTVNPADEINKALLLNEYNMYLTNNTENQDTWFNNISENMKIITSQEFTEAINLPLYEMVEHFINIFNLNSKEEEIPFILNFLDCIRNFSSKPLSSQRDFIEWWNENSYKKNVSMNDEKEAVKVVTIHKSKGMQYEAVVIPYPSWGMLPLKENIIWCNCKKEPFNELPVFPIIYNKDMQYSFFAQDYFEESLLSIVDNINLLYVATTRAKSILQIACPTGERTKTTYIYNLINDSIFNPPEIKSDKKIINLNSFYNSDNKVLEIGKLNDVVIEDSSTQSKINIATPKIFNSFNKDILISDNTFGTISKETNNKIKYGTLLHTLLSLIKNKDEAENTLQRFCNTEKISLEEQKQLSEIINNILNIPNVIDWFKPDNIVITERGIIEKSGKIYRPDRVIINNNKVIVIDYKTGQYEIQKHKEQITKYINLLKEMNYNNIEGWLLYTDLMKCEKVFC
ncbi:MAG: UvrD-helicase domain-containing protein [Bacteroidetes bacterium]|nr:UvrD-helicase domain-containing protein [Bacteroidota bacterium]